LLSITAAGDWIAGRRADEAVLMMMPHGHLDEPRVGLSVSQAAWERTLYMACMPRTA
jgi:hypothetical protein